MLENWLNYRIKELQALIGASVSESHTALLSYGLAARAGGLYLATLHHMEAN